MPELVVAGSVIDAGDAGLELAGDAPAQLRYAPAAPAAGSGSYPVTIEPRLWASIRRTERGWVATAPTLGALGYGETPPAAADDLLDAIEQYLEFLREDAPCLASAIIHHADYVPLLDLPRGAWLASVSVDASQVE